MALKLARTFEIEHSGHRALKSMEGLRGFAVLLVFLVHYTTMIEPWIRQTASLAAFSAGVRSLGNMGVDLFFVLSGYLIYGALISKRRAYFPFIRRRLERIYPTFAAVFSLYVVLAALSPASGKVPSEAWAAFRYFCANFLLLPGIFDITPLITVAWSLSYEMFFYLTIPVIVGVLALRRWHWGARVAFFVTIALLVWLIPQAFGGHVRFIMFAAGMLLYELTRRSADGYLDVIGMAGLAVALLHVELFHHFGIYGGLRYLVLAVAFLALCFACFSCDGICRRAFSWTPLRWLGNISYSFYLLHGLALHVFFSLLAALIPADGEEVLVFWLGLPLAFSLAFIVSTLLFIAVERPLSLMPATSGRTFLGMPKRHAPAGLPQT